MAKARAQAIDQGLAEFNHDGFDELLENRSYLGQNYDLSPFRFYGENISEDSTNTTDHADVFNGWQGSPSHNALMLSKYTHGCVRTSQDVAVLITGSNTEPY
jgi:uncharacterized protein YkwD